jgi:hypothetical protein
LASKVESKKKRELFYLFLERIRKKKSSLRRKQRKENGEQTILEFASGVGITFEKPDRIELDRIDNFKNLIGSTISKT